MVMRNNSKIGTTSTWWTAVVVIAAVLTLPGCTQLPPEERFWNEVDKDPILAQIDRDTLLAAGDEVCDELGAGSSLAEIRVAVELSGVPADQVTRLYSATAYICPDFFDELKGIKPG